MVDSTSKPGIKSTEFWFGLVLPQLLAIGIGTGLISPEFGEVIGGQAETVQTEIDVITKTAGNSIQVISASVLSLISAFKYIKERSMTKRAKVAAEVKFR